MATRIQLRRGNTSDHSTFTGARTVSAESNCEVYVASSTVPFAETITT